MIALHGRQLPQHSHAQVRELLESLLAKGPVLVSDRLIKTLQKLDWPLEGCRVFHRGDSLQQAEMLISLGGDGTLLEAVTYVGAYQTPVLGLNLGRLGFLAAAGLDQSATLVEQIDQRQYTIQQRSLLQLTTEGDFFEGQSFAMNEFAVTKKDTSSMITVKAYVDGVYLNSYWADGLIVATPTGSTGYSLSCGGPLVSPGSNTFVLTPVSPHNLTVRPMVVSDDSQIDLEVEGRDKNILISLDSRSRTVEAKTKLRISKLPYHAGLVLLPNYDYFATLRDKLHWGADHRN